MSHGNKYKCNNAFIQYGDCVRYPPLKPRCLHIHDAFEIYCVFQGNGYYVTEGSRHRLEHGRIFLMRGGEMHMADLVSTAPYHSLALHFSADILDSFDPDRRLLAPFLDRPLGMNNVYDRSVIASTGIYSLFQKMRELKEDNEENCVHVTALLFAVLSELKKLFDEKRYNAPARSYEVMQSVVSYVNDNLALELTPELLCDKFHLSRAQLDRNFKNTTGSTVWCYITTKRLLLGQSYIVGGMHATEAAYACGFKDYSTFYRAYRKHFGCAPTDNANPAVSVLHED
jgi:AraC-like DNA-binding protein